MGQSFETYRNRILLVEVLSELFDSSPFKSSFNFQPSHYGTLEVPPFLDPDDNVIHIVFHEKGEDLYEVEFTVNGDSFKAESANYTLKQYSELLSTVALALSKFLEQEQPQGLVIKGADSFEKVSKNSKKIGQKDRLYLYFISQIDDLGKYMVDKTHPEGIALMKKNSK